MPGIARLNDTGSHCGAWHIAESSTTWYVDGRGIAREDDANNPHLTPPDVPPCPVHSAGMGPPNRGWTCDGERIAALGDIAKGCTPITSASGTWFIG